jgi:FimV-like protein
MKRLFALFLILLSVSTTSCANTALDSTWQYRYGPTTAHDHLWKIARHYQRNCGISLEQIAVAIYNANPRAFKQHNMNGLMAGYVLTIPTAGEIMAVSEQASIYTVNEQNKAWQQPVTQLILPDEEVSEPVVVLAAPLPSRIQPEMKVDQGAQLASGPVLAGDISLESRTPVDMTHDNQESGPSIEQQLQQLQTQNEQLAKRLEQQQVAISDIKGGSGYVSTVDSSVTIEKEMPVAAPSYMNQWFAVLGVLLLFVILMLLIRIYKFTRHVPLAEREDEFSADDIDVISGDDSHDTQLDLANAYIELGRLSEADELLEAVIAQGSQDQIKQARQLRNKIQNHS